MPWILYYCDSELILRFVSDHFLFNVEPCNYRFHFSWCVLDLLVVSPSSRRDCYIYRTQQFHLITNLKQYLIEGNRLRGLPIQACSAMHMNSIQAMPYIFQVDPKLDYYKRHSSSSYEDGISDYVKVNKIGKVI